MLCGIANDWRILGAASHASGKIAGEETAPSITVAGETEK
jgi:hypothetical protein